MKYRTGCIQPPRWTCIYLKGCSQKLIQYIFRSMFISRKTCRILKKAFWNEASYNSDLYKYLGLPDVYIRYFFLRTIYTNLRPHVSWICFRRSASSSWLPSPGPKWFTPSCRVEQLHRRDTWPPWVSVSKFLDMTLKLQKAWIGQMAMIDRDQFLLYTEIHLNFL